MCTNENAVLRWSLLTILFFSSYSLCNSVLSAIWLKLEMKWNEMKLHLELTSSLFWQLPQNSWCDELTSDHELGDIVWNCGLLHHHNGWQLRFVTDKPLYAMSAGFSLAGTYLHGSGFVCVCICPTRLATNDLYTWLRLHIQQSTFILSLLNLTAEISIPSTGDNEFARLSARTAAINSRRGMLTDSNWCNFCLCTDEVSWHNFTFICRLHLADATVA